MKNKAAAALAALVLLFSGFTGGFFLGRNTRVQTIQTTKAVLQEVPGEMVVLTKEILVTVPPEATEATVPPRSDATTTARPVETKPKSTKPAEDKVTFPVNINSASKRELDALPGIGEVLAQRIIASRSANGPFQSVDELIKIKGIGEKTLAKLKPYATV